jgi:hypothetical protein
VASWRRRPAELPPDRAVIAYRQTDRRWPALWTGAGDRLQASARWHERGEGDEHVAQYLSLHPLGAWGELVRYQGIRAEAQLEEARRRLWRLVVRPRGIADLSTFDAIDACGLDAESFVSDGYGESRALAAQLRAGGFAGLTAPSAALPGVVNLTLFGPRFPFDDAGGPVPPLPDDVIAASVAADAARPGTGVLAHVRHYGAAHAGYEAWRRGCQPG